MPDMNRRDFLVAAVGSAGLLGASGLLDRSSAYAEILAETSAHVYSRRNVYCMTAGSREIIAYSAAIKAMKALPATNPVSWLAQANIHGAVTPPSGMITNACQHNTTFFLSWHRMYLYFFERIVRKMSGDSSFALPYWAYSPTGKRDLPAMFRSPASTTNWLYDATRNATVNAGTPLTPSVVDSGLALSQVSFWDFTNVLNGTPHGAVHIATGGNMTAFATAGQDPIFWLHHCNIDRLWQVWLESGGGRVDPTTDTSWMTTPFKFYDESGATVTLTGAQVVDIACQLHYQYESDVCGRIYVIDPDWWRRYTRLPVVPVPIITSLDTLIKRPPLPDPVPLGQQPAPVRLGGRPVQVAIPVSQEVKAALRDLTSASGSGAHLNLVLSDIRVEGRPSVIYEIYLNLRNDQVNADYTSPNFVGLVNLFGPGADTAHANREDQIVPLTLTMLRLRANKAWSDDTVRVTFIPRGVTEGADPTKTLGAATPVTIGRMALQLR